MTSYGLISQLGLEQVDLVVQSRSCQAVLDAIPVNGRIESVRVFVVSTLIVNGVNLVTRASVRYEHAVRSCGCHIVLPGV